MSSLLCLCSAWWTVQPYMDKRRTCGRQDDWTDGQATEHRCCLWVVPLGKKVIYRDINYCQEHSGSYGIEKFCAFLFWVLALQLLQGFLERKTATKSRIIFHSYTFQKWLDNIFLQSPNYNWFQLHLPRSLLLNGFSSKIRTIKLTLYKCLSINLGFP